MSAPDGPRIAVFGSPRSGRTTFLASIPQAADELRRSVEQGPTEGTEAPGWRAAGADPHTEAFTSAAHASMVGQDRFPGGTPHSMEYGFRFARRTRRRPWREPTDRQGFVATFLDLPDLAGTDAAAAGTLLNSCSGLIYLLDPVRGRDHDLADSVKHFTEVLDAAAAESGGRSSLRVAVCVTKIDEQVLFHQIRREGLVEMDRSGRIRVPRPRRLFEWLCHQDGPLRGDGASALAGLLRERFRAPHHYATSSVGFRARSGQVVDPENCRTVDPETDRLKSRPRPQGVLEPILWLSGVHA